jgi:membrane AbrB-like protein
MQYSRVLLVAFAAALVARFWAHVGNAHAPAAPWFGPVPWGNLALVLILALLAQQFARVLRLQAWALLGPMILLSALHAAGWLQIDLPRWLLAAAYACFGWYIGLGFRRDALIHAGRAMPVVIVAALSLMGFCAALAWCLVKFTGTDALTAYLATSPGGIDSIAIIASSTPQVDMPFVLALQSVRLLFVIKHSPHLQKRTYSARVFESRLRSLSPSARGAVPGAQVVSEGSVFQDRRQTPAHL